ncbi:hypothetical protein LPMP_160230 [Leishmania panamensis]|uniref:Uncharacterized protein n=3 Tax=Viannia TaxID=37616 RepID=A4H8E8_LEIBR|nr:hypothetical protein, unknown function [Leishmania braziliensis MHOM/BR/75/M2904]XP_010697551.1 hypothetical protein LPMP_160230 [Leishmania panamensis]CAJ2469602.1 unnamed protein product [Leishmania braziliensis]AIN96898.1 hypothetical protein LPMP_160230 [Leishmania panamensis]CAJ2470112.1 unnamed protein product [Leishmania braziliensis]CAM37662.1 hypothetical protein, unknown function [Leishmania braziliensis MHOM/BR/75/M2904]
MEHALLQVVHLHPPKTLLRYDSAAHKEKLKLQPHPYAASSCEDCETVATDGQVAAYTDLLDFITGAQQECYALFGEDDTRWSVDDRAEEECSAGTLDSGSVRVNSSEWSEGDGDDAHGVSDAPRKRKRPHAE